MDFSRKTDKILRTRNADKAEKPTKIFMLITLLNLK
jgi:hypothetical protein